MAAPEWDRIESYDLQQSINQSVINQRHSTTAKVHITEISNDMLYVAN